MTTRNLAMTAASLVTVAACGLAGATAWLLVTAPATVALAVQARDAQPLAQFALHALFDAVMRLARYL